MTLEQAGLIFLLSMMMIGVVLMIKHVMSIFQNHRKKMMLEDVELWLQEYKTRMNRNNRFLLNEEYLRMAFPEYSQSVVRMVWREMIELSWVVQDATDREWIIKP